MTASDVASGDEPYKFLDSYGPGDRDIFVARDREAETLVGDVVSSRLVVLFAKTGTGKTSLINAGVRPRLADLDYETFYARVERDPVDAVRNVLRERGVLSPAAAASPLPEALRLAAQRLEKPTVVFFDQFEEFFIHFGEPERADRIAAFIHDVASLYRDVDSGVHMVFSMREEYFVEMDVFREEIPSIFHNESSLRLRAFRPEQAIAAIVLPAERRGVTVDEGLPERVVGELSRGGLVEPAGLSIVCDTLWRAGGERALRTADYERLGGAEAIVSRRLEQDIATLSDEHLHLLGALLPHLRTVRGTKYLRGFDELAKALESRPGELDSLVHELKSAHLMHESVINRDRYVEWVSDYVAARTDALSRRAQLVLDRRLVERALTRAHAPISNGGPLDQVLPLSKEELERLAREPQGLELQPEEARLMLVTAIALGVAMETWWKEAVAKGVDVWALLRHVLRAPEVTGAAQNALELVVDLGDDDAVAVLEQRLREPGPAAQVLDALGRLRSERAAQALARAVVDSALARDAVDALRRMGTDTAIGLLADALARGGVVGLRAGTALDALAGEPEALGRSKKARAAIERVLDDEAAFLFNEALLHGVPPRFWFDRARERGVDVWAVLRALVSDSAVPVEKAENALLLLHELEEREALDLLVVAAAQPRLRERAENSLEARGALEQVRRARDEAVVRGRVRRGVGGGLRDLHWSQLLEKVALGRCVPIVGPGTAAGVLPLGSEIAQQLAHRYDVPVEDRSNLARVADALEAQTDRLFVREQVAAVARGHLPDFSESDEPHALLAELPLPIYVTANFDTFLEAALTRSGRQPVVETGDVGGNRLKSVASEHEPSTASPLVVHVYGHASRPESLVLTDTDLIRFVFDVAEGKGLDRRAAYALAEGSALVLGFSPSALSWRVLWEATLFRTDLLLRRDSFIVALPPENERERELVERQLERMRIVAYWGTPRDFTAELRERWQSAESAR